MIVGTANHYVLDCIVGALAFASARRAQRFPHYNATLGQTQLVTPRP